MLANMCHGGKIAMLGIPTAEMAIDWTTVIFNMLTIKGIYGREMYETWYKMTVMLQSGLDISPVITHRFPTPISRRASTRCARQVGQGGSDVEGRVELHRIAALPKQHFEQRSSTRSARGPVQGRAGDHDAAERPASAPQAAQTC